MSNKTKNEKAAEVSQEMPADQGAPIATLLSSISYTNQEDYEKFLDGLTTEHALIVLISAANHCQAKGIFNLEEAELVAKAIRKISKPQPQEQQEGE
jgi:hypothetical protein